MPDTVRQAFRAGPVRVRVPASSANLGPGFDAFGLALGLYDEVEVEARGSGLAVSVAGEGADSVPRDADNLVVRAMRAAFDRLGRQPAGLAVSCDNVIPHGRGLGSSAAAIVAGVVGARALVPDGAERLDDRSALAFAAELEGHPDNVAAALLGGLTLAWYDGGNARAVRVEPAAVTPVAFVPSTPLSTEAARGLLPADVPHSDAAANAGRAGLLVATLTGAAGGRPGGGERPAAVDLDLLLAATEDRLHQAYRAPAMPASLALVGDLRARGIPAVVSGAGPTVLAFARVGGGAEVAAAAPVGFDARMLGLAREGASTSFGRPGMQGRNATFSRG